MPFDVDAAISHLNQNAEPGPTGRCAAYVRQALQAGGLDLSSRPTSAKDYGPYLTHLGFKSVDVGSYRAEKGDVVVIQNHKSGDLHGHIAMYDGTQWISDFRQHDMWGGPGYRKNKPSFEGFRP